MSIPILRASACCLLACLAAAAEPESLTGTVSAVTLYRNEARVTRELELAGPAGAREILIGSLPEQTNGSSLYAEGGEGVEVRAVRFRTRAVGEQPVAAVQEIDTRLQEVGDRLQRNQALQALIAEKRELLDQLADFVAPTAKAELATGVLDAETLRQLTEEQFARRRELIEESLALQTEARAITQKQLLLQRKRAELTSGSTRTVREALVFLEKRVPGAAKLRLNYLVSSAGWSPTYNIRAAAERDTARVEFNAVIRQFSGEDWSGVEFTLSTASPAINAQGAGLAPYRVTLGHVAQQAGQSGQQLEQQIRGYNRRRFQAQEAQQQAAGFMANMERNWDLNEAANDLIQFELQANKNTLRLIRTTAGDEPSITYTLDERISLDSRNDQQMVQIADLELPGVFYHVATPQLTSYVYREAEIDNRSAVALLGGPVAVYLNGRFVGRGEIPSVARGQTFVMGFGTDPQLRARRELADRSERVQGGNRVVTFAYRLILENFKDEPVVMRVMDRIPVAERGADIRITLENGDTPLSEDKLYLRDLRPKGILRWDLEVPARAIGDATRDLAYGYKMEYDRKLAVTNPQDSQDSQDSQEKARQEFRDMQKQQYLR